MAMLKASMKSSYPLPAYSFKVVIGDQQMSFSEVTGFKVEYESVTYSHGLSHLEGDDFYKYRIDKYIPITLKRGTVKGANFLHEWLLDKEKSQRVMEVSLCDEQGVPVVSWSAGKVVAIKLEAANFDANSNDVFVETLEVMAANISVKHHEG
ncbi:MAG: phage tail protein [Pseudomonadales bacterium]|nr:phage tail protein [Pseudomonadales bacterium]